MDTELATTQCLAQERARLQGQAFLQLLRQDIAGLSLPAVEMAAALVAVQFALPKTLSDWLLAELGYRADLRQVSPAATAAMQIGGVSTFMNAHYVLSEDGPEFALIRLLGKEAALHEASKFLALLVHRLDTLARAPT